MYSVLNRLVCNTGLGTILGAIGIGGAAITKKILNRLDQTVIRVALEKIDLYENFQDGIIHLNMSTIMVIKVGIVLLCKARNPDLDLNAVGAGAVTSLCYYAFTKHSFSKSLLEGAIITATLIMFEKFPSLRLQK